LTSIFFCEFMDQKKNLANIQPSWPRTWSITRHLHIVASCSSISRCPLYLAEKGDVKDLWQVSVTSTELNILTSPGRNASLDTIVNPVIFLPVCPNSSLVKHCDWAKSCHGNMYHTMTLVKALTPQWFDLVPRVLIYFWYLKGGHLFETGCLFPFWKTTECSKQNLKVRSFIWRNYALTRVVEKLRWRPLFL